MMPDEPRASKPPVPAPVPAPPAAPSAGGRPALDRAAVDRVLRRAAELQTAGDVAEAGSALTEEQLIELGAEVGLSAQHLRQALAEERTRAVLPVPVERGPAARLAGPATVSASRIVRGRPEEVLAALDRWMQRDECLQVKRRFADRVVWEARADLFGNLRRAFNLGGRGYHLSRAHDVAGTVIALDAGQVMVRLDADLSNQRTQRLTSGGLAVGGGATAAGVLLAIGFFAPVAVIPAVIGAGAGLAILRGQPAAAARAQLALEQVLDRLEHGESRPSLLGMRRA
jgi:hypothetical protein